MISKTENSNKELKSKGIEMKLAQNGDYMFRSKNQPLIKNFQRNVNL